MIRLLVSAIVLSLNGVEAHEPEETIYPVFWWWPEELQPVIDGIPDLPLQDESTFAGFWPYMISSKWSRTQENEAPDPHSLYSQILVGWGEPGQLYIQEWRYDDQWSDPNPFVLHFDADHSGTFMPGYSLSMGYEPTTHDFSLSFDLRGREPAWYESTEYVSFAFSYMDGPPCRFCFDDIPEKTRPEHWMFIESAWTLFDPFSEEDGSASVVKDLEPGMIIGLSWTMYDLDQYDRTESRGFNITSHFQLQEPDDALLHPYWCCADDWESLYGSVISADSWGRIKQTFLSK